ncbi:MAG: hypothetical protein ABIT01_08255 [Thermoanaerobaculia bacterium]
MTPDRPTDSSTDPAAHAAGRNAEAVALDPGQMAADQQMETILDECLTSFDVLPDLSPDFTERVVAARPFAPWEVRRATFWKAPALVAGSFLAFSLSLFVSPLLRLGPLTALTVWFRVLLASVGKPVAAILLGAPLLAEALEKLAARGSTMLLALVAAGAVLSTGVLLAARKWRGLARTRG